MANQEIAFGLKIDGVEQTIKSVKDLKSAISAMQTEAENADIGSDQYKNAIENIEKLNDKLKEVTQTEKQAAKATEDLAKAEQEAAKETGDLRKQFEVLEDELFMLAGQGKQNSAEFKKLTIEAANLNKKIDDVNQSLSGGGAERAEGGFSKLSESLGKLDFKGVAQGAKMMGTALASTGIMLIVKAVSYLIENFDELSQGSGALSKMLKMVGTYIGTIIERIMTVITFITDLIGITSESERAMEAQGQAIVDAAGKTKKALDEQVKGFDNQIAAAKAAGKSTVALEIEKQNAILETNKKITDQLIAFVRSGGVLNEEQKKLLTETIASNKAAVQEQKIITITANKETNDKIAEQNKEAAAKRKEAREKEIKEELEKRKSLEEAQLSLSQIVAAEKLKVEDDNSNALVLVLDKITQKKLDDRKKEKEAYAELEKEKFNLAKQGLDGVQALSDMYFLFKSQKAQKGSKEEEELAKKAFNVNKALQLATATVNGIQSVQGAFTTATASPITTLLPAYPFIQAGLAGVFAAANIAKIAASKFTGGGGGSVAPSGGAPSTPSIPPPPTIATPENNTNKTTSFDETGKNLNFQGAPTPTINVKASVGVDEITSKSNRVEVLENQSTF